MAEFIWEYNKIIKNVGTQHCCVLCVKRDKYAKNY